MRPCLATLCLATAAFCAPAAAFERAPLPSEAAMEPCPQQGPGFVKIPGTATCIRLSGRVSAEAGATYRSPVGGRFQIDSRVPSESGTARSFLRIGAGR